MVFLGGKTVTVVVDISNAMHPVLRIFIQHEVLEETAIGPIRQVIVFLFRMGPQLESHCQLEPTLGSDNG